MYQSLQPPDCGSTVGGRVYFVRYIPVSLLIFILGYTVRRIKVRGTLAHVLGHLGSPGSWAKSLKVMEDGPEHNEVSHAQALHKTYGIKTRYMLKARVSLPLTRTNDI